MMIVHKGRYLRGGGYIHGLVAPLLLQLLHNKLFSILDSALSGTQLTYFNGTLFSFWRDWCYGSDDKCPMYYARVSYQLVPR